jgi:hypothetical protein
MAYCTPAELELLVNGTTIPTTMLTAIIAQSDREIDTQIRAEGSPEEIAKMGAKAKESAIDAPIARAEASVAAYIKINRTDLPLPISITVGRQGARVGEFAEMTAAEEDVR